jgi:hypothetical protein
MGASGYNDLRYQRRSSVIYETVERLIEEHPDLSYAERLELFKQALRANPKLQQAMLAIPKVPH